MSLKTQRQRERLAKKMKRGFRGYPIATIACYGPTDTRASKLVVGIVASETAGPDPLEKWYSDTLDVRRDPDIIDAVLKCLTEHGVKSVIGMNRIIGCPHEEGIDYPDGEWCPKCAFWRNRDRFTGKLYS